MQVNVGWQTKASTITGAQIKKIISTWININYLTGAGTHKQRKYMYLHIHILYIEQ